jgi:Na+-driven multidrug efflux pump
MLLDPIFIIVLGMGVEGAAWATIISQFASMIWLLSFSMSKKAVIRLDLRKFSFKGQMVTKIAAYGSAQFLLQFIMSAVQLLVNMSIGWYGAAALGVANGGDIALSGMTIIGSVNQLFFMPIFGINQGAQPILGYNYGAQKYDRVRHAYRVAVLSASCVCTLGFLVLELFPLPIIHLFSPDASPALIQFAPTAMRYMMIFMPFAGFQIVSSNFFVVTGRPRMSIFLTTLRQCIAFIPCLLIFGRLWGLWGIVAAQPVADCFSLIITAIFIGFELKRLSKQIKEQKNVS